MVFFLQSTTECYFKSNNLESSYQMLLFTYEETQLMLLRTYLTVQISLSFQKYYLGEDLQIDGNKMLIAAPWSVHLKE